MGCLDVLPGAVNERPPRRAAGSGRIPRGTTISVHRRPFLTSPHSFTLPLSVAPVHSFPINLRFWRDPGLLCHQTFLSTEAQSHVAVAMRFFSPAQALAALSLSFSALRLHVAALTLDPASQGTYAFYRPAHVSLLNLRHRLNQRCIVQSRQTACCAVCDY